MEAQSNDIIADGANNGWTSTQYQPNRPGRFSRLRLLSHRGAFVWLARIWTAWLITLTVFAATGMMWLQTPPTFWLISTGVIVGLSLLATQSIVRHCWRDEIARPIGVLILCWMPMIWWGCLIWSIAQAAHDRAPLKKNMFTRVIGVWAESCGHVETWLKYPRQTEGQHVYLIDRGQQERIDTVVDAMDRHVEQMHTLLGAESNGRKSHWVRGKVLGFNGRAIAAMAIANESNADDLTYLDRHEVAHTSITLLGDFRQDPPMLLAEGWAESQSVARQDLIRNLTGELNAGVAVPIYTLLDSDFYSRSYGPVYGHGGPFVTYLIETFGGPAFLQLYHSIRPATWAADFQRVYDKPLHEIEADFWIWLKQQGTSSDASLDKNAKRIRLSASVDVSLWEEFAAGVARAENERANAESKFQLEAIETLGTKQITAIFVMTDDSLFGKRRSPFKLDYAMISPLRSFRIRGNDSNNLRREVYAGGQSPVFYRQRYIDAGSLSKRLPITARTEVTGNFLITDIQSPAKTDSKEWTIQWQSDSETKHDREDPSEHIRQETVTANVAADKQFQIVRIKSNFGRDETNQLGRIGGLFMPIQTSGSINSSYHKRIRELSSVEVDKLAAELETIDQSTPHRDPAQPPKSTWSSMVTAPRFVAWGTLGLACLFVFGGNGSWRSLMAT